MKSIKAKKLHDGKEERKDVFLNFKDGKIVSVSKKPLGGIEGEYDTVIPAIVDPHCHIGMFRSGEPPSEADVNDKMDSILPLVDALDAVQMDDPAFSDSVESGVLYSCVLPGSANIIGGQTAVIRNYAGNATKAFIRRAGLKAAFGFNTKDYPGSDRKGKRATTRMGCMAILRSEFHKILDAKKKSDLSREQLAMKEVLDGKTVLRCHAHKTDDIAAILRLKREFGIRVSIEHALNVTDKETFAELAELGVPVVYGPIEGIGPKCELKNMKWRNIGLLIEAGGPFGLMSDHDINPQCDLLLTTRFLLRFGYSKTDAIRKITLDNAAIIGLDDVLGSLEKGKFASFACWDGDPFDLASKPAAVYAEGRIVHRE